MILFASLDPTKVPSVLLSSEVGGEGVDLQFSWVVINYDLPWNPMRVEQRIGRVDRLGQQKEKVLIWNLFYADTVDARIYECLYDKLDLCRNALGDFEEILGEEVKKLTNDLFTRALTPRQQKARISQTAQALEVKKQEEVRLESEAVSLVAYGDYILQQIKAAKDMNHWINGSDLFSYVTDFMNIHYSGYQLSERAGETHEYDLSLTTQAKHDLSEFIREKNLVGQTQLTQNVSRVVPCRFENRMLPEVRTKMETISQFHPLIRFISARISESVVQIQPAVAVKVATADFDSGVYVLAVSLWSVQGLRDVEKLVYEAVFLERPDDLLGEDKAERLASICASNGNRWLEAGHVCDLNTAREVADDRLFGILDDRFDQFVEEEKDRNADRAYIQERNLERHFSKQSKTIQQTIARHQETGRMNMIRVNEGKLKAIEDRYKSQKLAIKSRRKVKSSRKEICVAVTLVE